MRRLDRFSSNFIGGLVEMLRIFHCAGFYLLLVVPKGYDITSGSESLSSPRCLMGWEVDEVSLC